MSVRNEFGRQAFFANVRAGNWKAAQLVRFSPYIAYRPAATFCGQPCLPVAPLPCSSSLKLIRLS